MLQQALEFDESEASRAENRVLLDICLDQIREHCVQGLRAQKSLLDLLDDSCHSVEVSDAIKKQFYNYWPDDRQLVNDVEAARKSFQKTAAIDPVQIADGFAGPSNGNDDEYVEVPETVEADDSVPNVAIVPTEEVIDGVTVIRIGKQPHPPSRFVGSANPDDPFNILHTRVNLRFTQVDKKMALGQVQIADIEAEREAAVTWLKGHTITDPENGSVSVLDAYTGMPMSWLPGARSLSIEATYPYVVSYDRLAYHAVPNVCLVSSCVNYAKAADPAVTLPLVAEWLRIQDGVINFATRQRRLAWVYNAIVNAAFLADGYGLTINAHVDRVNHWDSWTRETQRAVLETLRTGTRTMESSGPLRGLKFKLKFRMRGGKYQAQCKRLPISLDETVAMYGTCLDIAGQYGLSEDDFEYFFTISVDNRRIFYPFYVLSRPEAVRRGFNWADLLEICKKAVSTLQDGCNKPAQDAGYGEPALTPKNLVFWLAAWFSKKLVGLRTDNPTWTQDQLLWSLTDRWAIPLLPFMNHPFSASFSKLQDHGIAMKFGFMNGFMNGDEEFDPLRHIDLAQSTVTVDSWFTNRTMHCFNVSDWPSMRELITRLPIQGPFWNPDLTMGDEPWAGASNQDIVPQAPLPGYNIPLLPTELWMGADDEIVFSCGACVETFQDSGSLIQHYRTAHEPETIMDMAGSTVEEDQVAWAELMTCKDCGHRSKNIRAVQGHLCGETCDICGQVFTLRKSLIKHRGRCRADKHKCQECDEAFSTFTGLHTHLGTQHPETYPHRCEAEGCVFVYKTAKKLNTHYSSAHSGREYPCPRNGCDKVYASNQGLKRHIERDHRN